MVKPRANIPNTPVARRSRITELLSARNIKSQGQLEKLLVEDGLEVTQATLSRDLEELGAVKTRNDDGVLVYAVPGQADRRIPEAESAVLARVAKRCEEVLLWAEYSGNLVVLRTPPGAAHFLAIAIDNAEMSSIIGTIAGDDTVVLVARDPSGGQALAAEFTGMAEGTRPN